MVVPIRDIENKSSFTSTFHTITLSIGQTNNTNIVIDPVNDLFKNICDNFDEVRGCSLVSSTHYPRTPSLFLSECDEDYATRVQRKSDKMVENDLVVPSDSLQLDYVIPKS